MVAQDTHSESIPNRWYAIFDAKLLKRNKPIGVKRHGLDLVLWRDGTGRAVVQHAACPHRGANLALGRIEQGCLACPYHGFRFSADGACVEMPCEGPDAKIRKDMRATTPPSKEAHGLIWMWYGDDAPDDELPWFTDRIPDNDPNACTTTFCWDVSLSRLVEGMMDFHHFPFAHRHMAIGVGAMLDPFEARQTGDLIESFATLRRPDQPKEAGFSGELSAIFPATIYVALGEGVYGSVSMCPVDDGKTWGSITYHQRWIATPWLGKLLTRFLLFTEMRFVQPDDERMLLSTKPAHATARVNKLVRADAAIAMWHKTRARALAGASTGAGGART